MLISNITSIWFLSIPDLSDKSAKTPNQGDGGDDGNYDELIEGSNSDTESSGELSFDPFALLEMRDKVEGVDAKADTVTQVGALDSKMDLVL